MILTQFQRFPGLPSSMVRSFEYAYRTKLYGRVTFLDGIAVLGWFGNNVGQRY
jgi:hypothetical protein